MSFIQHYDAVIHKLVYRSQLRNEFDSMPSQPILRLLSKFFDPLSFLSTSLKALEMHQLKHTSSSSFFMFMIAFFAEKISRV